MTTQVSTPRNIYHCILKDVLQKNSLLKAVVLFSLFGLILYLGPLWIRPIHITSGFIWWGMVFFINFLLIPTFPSYERRTQFEILGNLFPRIFRFATIFGFFTVSLGWYYALEYFANWRLAYFLASTTNLLFLVGICMVTGLYLFHLFLERHEIELVSRIKHYEISYDDPEVQNLISHLQIIPNVGFVIQTVAVIIMFVH